jgi:TRAP-type uncharacterized transport system substrate-binding protein
VRHGLALSVQARAVARQRFACSLAILLVRRPALPSPLPRPLALRVAVPVLLLLIVAGVVASLDLRPDLAHLDTTLYSGPTEGNYHAVAVRIAARTAQQHGQLHEITTQGSADNLTRLEQEPCVPGFALAQANLLPVHGKRLELVARLPKSESVFLLGRRADTLTEFSQLAGLRIGIGPQGSGTAQIAAEVLAGPDLAPLAMKLSNHPIEQQIGLAARGELDLALVVLDEDAALLTHAIRDQGLQIVGLPHIDVIARKFPLLQHGRIGAGQYDPVRMLPPVDKEVLRVQTVVVASRCVRRSQVLGLLTAMTDLFPDLVRFQRDTPNQTGLEISTPAKSFYAHDGLDVLDEYFPRLGDLMPPGNWVHVLMAVSILFNIMGLANRFVLWRIDAHRVRAEQDIARSFGPTATLGDIARWQPEGHLLEQAFATELSRVIQELEHLAARARRLSLSVLVPMGGELAYRYQEQVMHETLAVLRAFRDRRQRALADRQP